MHKQPTIQKANEKDIPEIVKIHRKCVSVTNAKVYANEIINEWLETIDEKNVLDQLQNTEWYVIKSGGVTVGFGQFDIPTGTLYQIHIDPDFQNKGFGKYLLNFILNEFKEHEVAEVSLFSTLSSVPFYESFGFVRIRNKEFPLNTGTVSMVEMSKSDLL